MEILVDGVKYIPQPAASIAAGPSVSLGELLRRHRKARGWTLDEVAAKATISKTFLCDLERGKRDGISLRLAARLARLYSIRLETMAAAMDTSGGAAPWS